VSDKPVSRRERADRDIEDAVGYYWAEAGTEAALGFLDALERAFQHIAGHPATGLSRYAHELDLPGFRAWRLRRYPYSVFYVERDDHIDVWRVLHGERDIPAWMREPESG
jgi:toxin ParE1/3/4